MIRRLVSILFVIPLAIVFVALAVANRESVAIRLDVFNPLNPALSFEQPLFVWLLGAMAIGVVAGGVGAWFAQGKHRRLERKYKKEAGKLRFEVEDKQRNASDGGQSLVLSRTAH